MIPFSLDDINPGPDDICDCRGLRATNSGRSGIIYFGYERCSLCGHLILTDPMERARVRQERLSALSTKLYRGEAPEIDAARASMLVQEYLLRTPDMSNTDLRLNLTDHGRFEMSTPKFMRLVRAVRVELGLYIAPPNARSVA